MSKYFGGKELNCAINPDEAVAYGTGKYHLKNMVSWKIIFDTLQPYRLASLQIARGYLWALWKAKRHEISNNKPKRESCKKTQHVRLIQTSISDGNVRGGFAAGNSGLLDAEIEDWLLQTSHGIQFTPPSLDAQHHLIHLQVILANMFLPPTTYSLKQLPDSV